jgi:hypothetical protein
MQRLDQLPVSAVGLVVEFSPATREARVRFPDCAMFLWQGRCRGVEYLVKSVKDNRGMPRKADTSTHFLPTDDGGSS